MLSFKLETKFFPELKYHKSANGVRQCCWKISLKLTEHSAAIPVRDEMIGGGITFESGSWPLMNVLKISWHDPDFAIHRLPSLECWERSVAVSWFNPRAVVSESMRKEAVSSSDNGEFLCTTVMLPRLTVVPSIVDTQA